jgi:general secretion pathway protein G
MHDTNFLKTLLTWARSKERVRAFTLIELLITVAIVGTLSAIAVPVYTGYTDESDISTAILDIRRIEGVIEGFRAVRGRPPDTLAEAGLGAQLDPWGNQYQYLRLAFEGVDPKTIPGHRKDAAMNPLNSDFDLYSMGKDGLSVENLVAPKSHDDVVRANNGAYVGLGSEY